MESDLGLQDGPWNNRSHTDLRVKDRNWGVLVFPPNNASGKGGVSHCPSPAMEMFDISGQMMVELLGACQLLNNEDAGPSPGSEHLRGSCSVSSSAFHSAPAMAQQAPGQGEVGSQGPFQGQAQGAQAYESVGRGKAISFGQFTR